MYSRKKKKELFFPRTCSRAQKMVLTSLSIQSLENEEQILNNFRLADSSPITSKRIIPDSTIKVNKLSLSESSGPVSDYLVNSSETDVVVKTLPSCEHIPLDKHSSLTMIAKRGKYVMSSSENKPSYGSISVSKIFVVN